MKKMFVTNLFLGLFYLSAFAKIAYGPIIQIAPGAEVKIPDHCKTLALMSAQLIQTLFYDSKQTGTAYNPSTLTLNTDNGLKIRDIHYLGGKSSDPARASEYACNRDNTLCENPANAVRANDWALVTVSSGDTPVAQVVVSVGSRGGCSLSSVKSTL